MDVIPSARRNPGKTVEKKLLHGDCRKVGFRLARFCGFFFGRLKNMTESQAIVKWIYRGTRGYSVMALE